METFKDKVILITGANRGIGKSLVKASLEKGAKKIYATARDIEKIPNFGDERVITLKLDITDNTQISHVVERTKDLEILINNAGIINHGNIIDSEISKIEKDMQTNYFGTIEMMKAFAPVLVANQPSKIINVASIVAYSSLPAIAGYSASKAALYSASQSVRIELEKKGVEVHIVNPGAIDTDMNAGSNMEGMTSPDLTAKNILNKVEKGELDIIPDEMGLGMFNTWKEEPSKLAKMFSDMYHGE